MAEAGDNEERILRRFPFMSIRHFRWWLLDPEDQNTLLTLIAKTPDAISDWGSLIKAWR